MTTYWDYYTALWWPGDGKGNLTSVKLFTFTMKFFQIKLVIGVGDFSRICYSVIEK
ncbi:hypothetical protein LAC03_13300 [Levilactobacillus acidifarinae]|nr:hypothetical protein LAC03_13300 [Levilactobacillus acidifarinae]